MQLRSVSVAAEFIRWSTMILANPWITSWGILILLVVGVSCSTGEESHRPVARNYPIRRDLLQGQPSYHVGDEFNPGGRLWQQKYLHWQDAGPSWGSNSYAVDDVQQGKLPTLRNEIPSQVFKPDAEENDDLIDGAALTNTEHVPYLHTKTVPQKKVEKSTQNDVSSSAAGHKLTTAYDLRKGISDPDITQEKTPEVMNDIYYVVIVAGSSAAAIFGVIAAGYCFIRMQKNSKAAADVEYPAYGVTGPNKDQTSPVGDRRLAQSAQMYHYQHQKQQMIAVEKAGNTRHTSTSDMDSEEENEEGDYTVYECPGLASTGEMEVKNPLFSDDATPASPTPIIRENEN